MPLTKSDGAIAQLTAAGNTDAITVPDKIQDMAVSLRHANGTGTITAQATVQPQISHDGTNFRNDGGPIGFGTTASAVVTRTWTPPSRSIKSVRFVYTVPTGSTGHTLNADWSQQIAT